MSLRVALGIDDFRQLRESGLEYVDKTQLIREQIDKEDSQVVILRRAGPRRGRSGRGAGLGSYTPGWFQPPGVRPGIRKWSSTQRRKGATGTNNYAFLRLCGPCPHLPVSVPIRHAQPRETARVRNRRPPQSGLHPLGVVGPPLHRDIESAI
ncbi:AAA family ATPase [Sorangium sp. So ce861]|uniref:AAA family ATPase n=1 Tax=Sorangium sp. So ce861 TaxID=3133323 RepID=UPI003F622BFD